MTRVTRSFGLVTSVSVAWLVRCADQFAVDQMFAVNPGEVSVAAGSLQGWRLEGSPAATELPVGPSDREVIDTLRRVALAQAHLQRAQAEADALRERTARADHIRDRVIGEAHADVEWAQAAALSAPRSRRAARELRLAAAREAAALRLHGFESWGEYDAHRRRVDTSDPHLSLAERETEAAAQAWGLVQSAFSPTVIIDLTGDDARVIT